MVANMSPKTGGGYPDRGSLGAKASRAGVMCRVPACHAGRAAVSRMVNAFPGGLAPGVVGSSEGLAWLAWVSLFGHFF